MKAIAALAVDQRQVGVDVVWHADICGSQILNVNNLGRSLFVNILLLIFLFIASPACLLWSHRVSFHWISSQLYSHFLLSHVMVFFCFFFSSHFICLLPSSLLINRLNPLVLTHLNPFNFLAAHFHTPPYTNSTRPLFSFFSPKILFPVRLSRPIFPLHVSRLPTCLHIPWYIWTLFLIVFLFQVSSNVIVSHSYLLHNVDECLLNSAQRHFSLRLCLLPLSVFSVLEIPRHEAL